MISEVLKKIENLSTDLNKRFDHIDYLFETVAQRFNQVDEHLESVDQRFECIDQRFDNIESKMVTKNQFNALIDVLAIRQGISGLEANHIKSIPA